MIEHASLHGRLLKSMCEGVAQHMQVGVVAFETAGREEV